MVAILADDGNLGEHLDLAEHTELGIDETPAPVEVNFNLAKT